MKKKFFTIFMMFALILPCIIFLSACGPKDEEEVKETGFEVYIDGNIVTPNNDRITLTYSPEGANDNWYGDHLTVYKTFSDQTKDQIGRGDYDFDDLTSLDVNANGYVVEIRYKQYTPVSIKVIVEPYAIARPTLISNEDSVYNGQDIVAIDYDINAMANYQYYTISDAQGFDYVSQINAGEYHTRFVLGSNYIWSTEVNGSKTAPHDITWKIAPKKVELPTLQNFVYSGSPYTTYVSANYSSYCKVVDGTPSYTNVGTYDVYVELLDKQNYVWPDGTTNNQSVQFEITANTSITNSVNAWQNTNDNVKIRYEENQNMFVGENPLHVEFSAYYGEDGNVYVNIFEEFTENLVAIYNRIDGVWSLYGTDGTTLLQQLDAGTYDATILIPANGQSYPEAERDFKITIYGKIINNIQGVVIPTEIQSATYTGEEIVADVPTSNYWTVSQNRYTNANYDEESNYTVVLTANANYVFVEDGYETKYKYLDFHINPVTDNAIENLTTRNFEIGAQYVLPTATSAFGEITYKFARKENANSNPENIAEYLWDDFSRIDNYFYTGTMSEDAALNSDVIGTYFVKATLTKSSNYNGDVKYDTFEITKIDFSNKTDQQFVVDLGADYFWAGSNLLPYEYEFYITVNGRRLYTPNRLSDGDFTMALKSGVDTTTSGIKTLVVTATQDNLIYTGSREITFRTVDSLANVEAGAKIQFNRNSAAPASQIEVNKNLTFRFCGFNEQSANGVNMAWASGSMFKVVNGTLDLVGEQMKVVFSGAGSIFEVDGPNACLNVGCDTDCASFRIEATRNEEDATFEISAIKLVDGNITIGRSYTTIENFNGEDVERTNYSTDRYIYSDGHVVKMTGGKLNIISGTFGGKDNSFEIAGGEAKVAGNMIVSCFTSNYFNLTTGAKLVLDNAYIYGNASETPSPVVAILNVGTGATVEAKGEKLEIATTINGIVLQGIMSVANGTEFSLTVNNGDACRVKTGGSLTFGGDNTIYIHDSDYQNIIKDGGNIDGISSTHIHDVNAQNNG